MCRQNCAYNLPSVVTFIMGNSSSYTVEKLYDVIRSLSSDSCYLVRQTVAGVFHDIAKILGNFICKFYHFFINIQIIFIYFW